jgi:hypothetical protein
MTSHNGGKSFTFPQNSGINVGICRPPPSGNSRADGRPKVPGFESGFSPAYGWLLSPARLPPVMVREKKGRLEVRRVRDIEILLEREVRKTRELAWTEICPGLAVSWLKFWWRWKLQRVGCTAGLASELPSVIWGVRQLWSRRITM